MLAAILLAALTTSAPCRIAVSPDGPDALERVRDRIRRMKATDAGLPPGGVLVELADGVYARTNAFELTAEDAGTPESPITYRAARGGKAVLSGARKLDWRPLEAGDPARTLLPARSAAEVLVARIPGEGDLPGFAGGGLKAGEKTPPYLIYQDGERLPCARWPNAKPFVAYDDVTEDRKAGWLKERDGWIWAAYRYLWDDIRVPLASEAFKPKMRLFVFNLLGELDEPGEWAVSLKERRAYLWPRGRKTRPVTAVAPELLRMKSVRHVTFEGLTVEYARGTAIRIEGSEDVTLRGLTVRHTGWGGVSVDGGRRCRVVSCDVADIGQTGVHLVGGNRDALDPSGHEVENCHIRDWGRYTWNYRPGVYLGGVGARCAHNLIHSARHQGVAFVGNDHYIGYNVVHDTCRDNEDSGAIYTYTDNDWSSGRGCVVEHNLVHATGNPPNGHFTFGIYIDGYASGVRVLNNIVCRAQYGIYQNGGQANEFAGNLVLLAVTPVTRGNCGLLGGKTPYPHVAAGRDCTLYRNLLRDRKVFSSPKWKAHSPELLRILDFDDPIWAQNPLFSTVTNNLSAFCGPCDFKDLDTMRGYFTIDGNPVLSEDPGFVDYAAFDWRLRDGSPARKTLGDLRFAEMGLRADAARPSPAVRFGADVTPPPPLRPAYASATVHLDFIFPGKYAKDDPCADGCRGCSVPSWDTCRKYVCANLGKAPSGEWRSYEISFVPRHDATAVLALLGTFGEKTLFDDLKMEGTELRNGSFEKPDGWTFAAKIGSEFKDWQLAKTDVSDPAGIVTGPFGAVRPADGRRMAAVTEIRRIVQPVKVRKGVRVTLRFKAAAEK